MRAVSSRRTGEYARTPEGRSSRAPCGLRCVAMDYAAFRPGTPEVQVQDLATVLKS